MPIKLLNKVPLIKWISDCHHFITTLIQAYREEKKIRFLLIEIDLESQKIIFRVKGRSLVIKSTIPQVSAEINIIKGLSYHDACYLGLCYGKLLRTACEGKKKIHFPKISIDCDNDETSRYQIVLQDRQGKIGYTDTHTQDFYLKSPMAIARNHYALRYFSSFQAWHIGVQAGIQAEKLGSSPSQHCEKTAYPFTISPQLRIVK